MNDTLPNQPVAPEWRRGSEWRRWDLHIHAPGTKLANGYGEPNDEKWNQYLKIIDASDIQVFGITDYFSFDCYFQAVEEYSKKFPQGKKVFYPNIEFRLTETISSDGKNVHTHVLFDNNPTVCSKDKLLKFLSNLETHLTNDGIPIRCNELNSTEEFTSATVSMGNLRSALKSVFSDENSYLIVTAGNNDGLRGVDTKSPRSMSISDEIDKSSHAFFGSAKNSDHFLKVDRYETLGESEAKPVFSGSDAHSFDDLNRLSGDEPNFEPTWIKADLTFRGLRQTLFEPKGRTYIGERPSVLVRQAREATRFIDQLQVSNIEGYSGENGSWFKNVTIPFSPELTAIIGNKGSGKSAIADIIALLAESRQDENFSFLTDDTNSRKFRRPGYAENFSGQLSWKSGTQAKKNLSDSIDTSKPEAVKYLPQNYFESLTNEIEVNAFRKEIEEVVFSHVDDVDRMGTSQFQELEDIKTAQSKSDISVLKTQLREINIELVDLEKQADPNFKKSLSEQLKSKKEEYQILESSKPKEVPKPDAETEDQRRVAEKIASATEVQNTLSVRGKEYVDRLATLKSDLQTLASIIESVTALGTRVQLDKDDLMSKCIGLGLDVEKIVSYKADLTSVNDKITETSVEVSKLENDSGMTFDDATNFDNISSIPDARAAYEFIAEKIKTLKETLSAPQKRFQNYLQALNEITSKQVELLGEEEAPKPGTIKFIENRIGYIENDLRKQIEDKRKARETISKSIFECKLKVRSFYEGLKFSVEALLEDVSSDEFSVTIDAALVADHNFEGEFFSHVNQNVKGPFRGNVDGSYEFQSMASGVDWNNFESIDLFVNSVIDKIKEEPVEAQVKDIKKFYDLLFSFEFFDAKYELRLGGKNLNQLSPGEKGLLLLVFYLHLDKEKTPLIIDQPEDNLDNESIFLVLAKCIREAKKSRQVILVTHNPNLAVGADAEQILYVTLEKHQNYKFTYESGSIENPNINSAIVKVLEGSRPAFIKRRLNYQIN